MIDKSLTPYYISDCEKNLENETSEEVMPAIKGDVNLGRQRIFVALPNGEQTWITGSTYSELIQSALTKYGGFNNQSGPSENFKDYTDKIFNMFLVPRWKESTANTNRNLFNSHILPYFKNMDLHSINTFELQKFFQTKQHLSKSYTKQMLILLHEIFENAVEDKLIKEDPTQSKRITLPQKVTKRKALEQNDFQDILEHLKDLEGDSQIFLALACYTGMRRGEILGLKWVNVKEDKIQIRSEVIYQGNAAIYNEYTKSASGVRDIPIPNDLKPYLAKRGTGFVLGGKKPYTQCKFYRMWERISKTINLHGATPHVFRHTYLSIMAASNVDPKTIQALAGHADFSFTFNKYIDKNKNNVQNAGAQFNDFCRNLTLKKQPESN